MSEQEKSSNVIVHKINGHSAYEAGLRGLKFQRSLLRGKVSEEMTREEMINRMILIKERGGEISENAIKRDSVLILYDVLREFGSIGAAKKAVKEEIRQRKIAALYGSGEPKMTKDEFKSGFKAQAATQETKKEEIPKTTEVKELSTEKEEEPVIIKRTSGKTEAKKDKRSIGKKRYTDEEIYQLLLGYARELGAVPGFDQIASKSKEDPDFPSTSTIQRKVHFDWRARMREELGMAEQETGKKAEKKAEKSAEPAEKPAEKPKLTKEPKSAKPATEPAKTEPAEKPATEPAKVEPTPAPSSAFYTTDVLVDLETELTKWLDAVTDVSTCSSNLDAFSTFRLRTSDVQIDVTLSAHKPQ